ncbi:Protein CBG16612 [Caenorhabditis briggsae]|uniref:Protein CBG16612 n=1 Tax=Caenorhabditis briggsae TaxID=6238 RepID=A8XPL3_CAEBR|nr:Protein CBG16612 [Caenorhabditis briggsae]CAP34534.2 Protein CBG16612 [Caenorhabditis briggsae]
MHLPSIQCTQREEQILGFNNPSETAIEIVWICPDPNLYFMIESSLQTYRTVDDINKSVQDKVSGYRNAKWLVNTVNYSRTTANTAPGANRASQNLCFVQAPDEGIIVFVAAVVS